MAESNVLPRGKLVRWVTGVTGASSLHSCKSSGVAESAQLSVRGFSAGPWLWAVPDASGALVHFVACQPASGSRLQTEVYDPWTSKSSHL